MQTTTVNGIRLAYRDRGVGQALVLLHAFPLSSAMWQPQIENLSGRYRLIAPDLRGFGESQLGDARITLDVYADDLVGLLDQLGIKRALIGGLSIGGYIAFALWHRYRDRVSGLILADTRATPDTDEGRSGREQTAQLAEQQGPGPIAEQMLPKLLSKNAAPELREQIRRMILMSDQRAIAAALRAMAERSDSTPLLATINVPTIVIVGSDDQPTPPADSRALHAGISGSHLVEIPDVGHLSNLEAPAVFNQAVEGFFHGSDKVTR